MHFRKIAARPEQTADNAETLNSFAGVTPNGSLIDRIALDEAIRQLSPGYRAVLILHDIEGYEHHQIGKMLGCAVGTSKSQLHKARMKLRRLLHPRKRAAFPRPMEQQKQAAVSGCKVNGLLQPATACLQQAG
jgi:DNA-directed RNA polymerase specialized sigma24 family protein